MRNTENARQNISKGETARGAQTDVSLPRLGCGHLGISPDISLSSKKNCREISVKVMPPVPGLPCPEKDKNGQTGIDFGLRMLPLFGVMHYWWASLGMPSYPAPANYVIVTVGVIH